MQNKIFTPNPRRPQSFIPIALVALICALPLIVGVWHHSPWLTRLDQPIVSFICHNRPGWLTTILMFITTLGDPLNVTFLAAIFALVLWWHKRPYQALFGLTNVAVMSGVNHLIKQWLRRPRPFVTDPSIHPLTTAGGFSFPSGHSAGAMLLYGSLIVLTMIWPLARKWAWGLRIASGLMIFLTGISRIYVQVHYPTDVFAGWLLALFGVSLLAYLWWPKIKSEA